MVNDYQVPQTPASLAQMSLAQRAEQAVLQERALEGQNEAGHVGDNHTVTIVGSGAGGNGLASGGTIQVRGLGQMAAGATLQLAQLAGGQVSLTVSGRPHNVFCRWFISYNLLGQREEKVGFKTFIYFRVSTYHNVFTNIRVSTYLDVS